MKVRVRYHYERPESYEAVITLPEDLLAASQEEIEEYLLERAVALFAWADEVDILEVS